MMLLMTAACSSSDDEEGQESGVDKKPVMLAVYVYAPQPVAAQKNAVQRRATVGNVDVSDAAEGEIRSLKLWIYETESGKFVGYLSTDC